MLAAYNTGAEAAATACKEVQRMYPCLCPLNVCPLDSQSIIVCIMKLLDECLIFEERILLEGEGDLVARLNVWKIFHINLNNIISQASYAEALQRS